MKRATVTIGVGLLHSIQSTLTLDAGDDIEVYEDGAYTVVDAITNDRKAGSIRVPTNLVISIQVGEATEVQAEAAG